MRPDRLLALYRVAKHPTKGAYPFFRDPRAMIRLREQVEQSPLADIDILTILQTPKPRPKKRARP